MNGSSLKMIVLIALAICIGALLMGCKSSKNDSAKTEDSGNLFLYLTMMLLSAVCAAWVSLAGEKKRKWK